MTAIIVSKKMQKSAKQEFFIVSGRRLKKTGPLKYISARLARKLAESSLVPV